MSAPGTELAALWLHKAQNDLVTGEQTLLLPDGPTDTVCFHAQQAAEKALKALLTAHESTAPRGHDLLRLLDLATEHLPELAGFRAPLAQMTAYAVEVRYPGDWIEPSREEAAAALGDAREVVRAVREGLGLLGPPGTTPAPPAPRSGR
ncbi:MAG: HEPN domain-containing protein [Deferrisomatales bacterium]|nr:HEPN domain-containing protein [Deferrisomatales bacterium]